MFYTGKTISYICSAKPVAYWFSFDDTVSELAVNRTVLCLACLGFDFIK